MLFRNANAKYDACNTAKHPLHFKQLDRLQLIKPTNAATMIQAVLRGKKARRGRLAKDDHNFRTILHKAKQINGKNVMVHILVSLDAIKVELYSLSTEYYCIIHVFPMEEIELVYSPFDPKDLYNDVSIENNFITLKIAGKLKKKFLSLANYKYKEKLLLTFKKKKDLDKFLINVHLQQMYLGATNSKDFILIFDIFPLASENLKKQVSVDLKTASKALGIPID